MKHITKMIENNTLPLTEEEKSEVMRLWNAGKIRESQRLAIELIEPKPKRTLL